MKYVHTNIISKDWKKLAEFYIEVFQCIMVPPKRKQSGDWLSKGTGVKGAHLEGVHLRLPGYGENGPTLEIYSYSINEINLVSKANRLGLGHLAFEVEDVAEVQSLVIKNGGSALGEVVSQNVQGKGKITFTYLKDPEGNIIEVQRWETED